MYKVQKIKPEDMDKKLYLECKSLSFRKNGDMAKLITIAKNSPNYYDSVCYYIKENKLLSWAIIFEDEIHFYTRKNYRRKGLAKLIAKKINKDYNEKALFAGKHDQISEKFYNNFKYKTINKQKRNFEK